MAEQASTASTPARANESPGAVGDGRGRVPTTTTTTSPSTDRVQVRRESAFAPNVNSPRGKARGKAAVTTTTTQSEAAKPSASAKEAKPSLTSRLGRTVAEHSGAGQDRKKSRLSLSASNAASAGSRLRTARASQGDGKAASERRGVAEDGTPAKSTLAGRVSTPLGSRTPAPSRAAKQMVPAVVRLETKLTPPQPVVSPLALPAGGVQDPGSPGAMALVAATPPLVVPAHRWVRSAGSTRGGRVGEGSRRDALEASTSFADDPAITIRDIIRRKSAEEKVNDAKERVANRAAGGPMPSKKPLPDFAKIKANTEPPAPLLALPGRQADGAASKLAVMAPQVQVIDGNIVINPQSLTVNAAAEKDMGMTEFKRVEEIGTRLNSATYSNRAKAEKWSKEDTELFYRAMTQFGTDFSLIARLFPGRSRRQVKRKYLIEDRADPRRIEQAIKSRDQDPMMYKNLIAVLQAQAAEGAEQSPALARVVLDAGGENEETPTIADAEEPPESEPKADAAGKATAKPKTAAAKPKARKAAPAEAAPPPAKAARASTRATRARK